MPDKMRKVVSTIMGILELLVLFMLTVISAQYVYHLIFSRSGAFKPALTDMLRVPKWWTGIAVPIGFGLSTYHSLVFLLRDKLQLFKRKKKEGGEEA
jgi:TRAP-type C4-dicarboxylate transport system permease small subunit